MTLISIVIFIFIAYLCLCGWDNGRVFRPLPLVDNERQLWPVVSVCVPARNEESRILNCLKSLQTQDYPNYEILVLDDQSSDCTLKILLEIAKLDKRIKVLKGKELPDGWIGKSWACHQLSLKAKGKWLFFTDADTNHMPETLKKSVRGAEESGADLMSCLNRQETGSWMEYLVVPVLVYCLITLLPVRFVLKRGNFLSKFAGASGQFLFFKSSSYKALGGHNLVKNAIVEDFKIGNEMLRSGYRLVFFDGTSVTSCRMYNSAIQVWEGFSKNFYPSFGFSVSRFLGICLCLLCISILPYIMLFVVPLGSLLFFALAGLSLIQVLLRLKQAKLYGYSMTSCFLHPLGVFFYVLIGLNSMRWYLINGQGHWKGRILKSPGSVF
jgi:chlorobactene glucosyltransferase